MLFKLIKIFVKFRIFAFIGDVVLVVRGKFYIRITEKTSTSSPSVSNIVVTMFDNQASECFFLNMVVTMFDRFKIFEMFS